MSFDLNEPPATAEEVGVPQQAALVAPQPHKPHSVATTYPSNLFQAGEGLQLHGTLNNNAFIHASSGSGFQPFERNKESLNTEVPILAEGPESIKDLECKEAEETTLAVMPQESSIVVPQTQQPLHHVLPTYPSNLLQTWEGSQMQGMLNNNVFHASEVERMKQKKDENIAELQRNFGVMEQNYADVNRRIGVLEHLSNANESLRKKEEELSALHHSFEVTEQSYADANKRIVVLEEHLRDANESLRKKEEELSALQHKFEVMEHNYADANKRIRVLEEHLTDANESLRKKEAELATLQHSFEVIELNYDANKRISEEQLGAANESLRKKEEELTALKHSFGVIDQNYAASRKRIRVSEDQASTVNQSLQKKEGKIAVKLNFGDIKQNYADVTKRIKADLFSAVNDLLKLALQQAQSIIEHIKKTTDAVVLKTPGYDAFTKFGVYLTLGNGFYKMIVPNLGNRLKKATEEHKKATEDDPMSVAGTVHELQAKKVALELDHAFATLCASIFSPLEDWSKESIPTC